MALTPPLDEIVRQTLIQLPLTTGTAVLGDDAFFTITPQLTSGLIFITIVSGSRNAQGVFSYDSSGAVLVTTATSFEATTGALNGTTGTDTKFIVSGDSSKIYLENRLGEAKNVHWLIIS